MSKTAFTLGAILVIAGTVTAAAERIKTLVASERVKAGATTLRTGSTVTKEIQVPYGGSVRATFEMASSAGATGPAVCTINGRAPFETSSTSFQKFTGVVPVEARGLVTLFCIGAIEPGFPPTFHNVNVRNFRVGYDAVLRQDDPIVIED